MAVRLSITSGVTDIWATPTDVRIADAGTWKRSTFIRVSDGGLWRNGWEYDVVGPSAVTSLDAVWSNSGGTNKCSVSWTQPSDLDLDYVDLYVNRSGSSTGPWTYLTRFSGSPGGAKSYDDTTVTMTSVTTHAPAGLNTQSSIHYYRLVPVDVLGNIGTASVIGSRGSGTTTVRGMLSSPYYVNPTKSRSWAGSWGNFATALDDTGAYDRVFQGWTQSAGQLYGYYWYDTKRAAISPTSVQLWLWRTDNGLNTITPTFQISQAPSSLVSAGGSPTGYAKSTSLNGTGLNNSSYSPYITSNWMTMTSSWWTSLMDGATWKSVLMYTGETTEYQTYGYSRHYAVFHSRNESQFSVAGGCIRAYHGG